MPPALLRCAILAMRENSSRESGVAIVPSNSVRSSTPKRIARGTSGIGREGDSAYSSMRFWRPISIRSSKRALVNSATRAPFTPAGRWWRRSNCR